MRFSELEIHSHQRSGSHYVAAVVAKNFLGTDDYLPYYKNHFINEYVYRDVWRRPNVGFIYVWRNWEDVVRSMWRFRSRLGLRSASKSEFENRPARELWRPGRCDAHYVGIRDTRATTGISFYFRDVPLSLRRHWQAHKNFWETLGAKENVKLVCYDDIVADFNGTMLDIAKWIGSDKTEFENIKQRIGWTCEEDVA
jgi:hypothetical protein